MRLLANENVPGPVVVALRAAGHDVLWVKERMAGAKDRDVLARAQADARLVVTFDKDFGELAVRSSLPSSSGVGCFGCTARAPTWTTRGPWPRSPVATTGRGTSRS